MYITLSVELDDGTKLERTYEVNSSDSSCFWTWGVERGVVNASYSIRKMIEAEYGKSVDQGLHTVKATARR